MSWTRMRHPPSGGRPATAMSPPRLTSTPQPRASASLAAERSAAHAFAVAPRSRRTPAGRDTSRAASSNLTCRHPGTALTRNVTGGPSAATSRKSRS